MFSWPFNPDKKDSAAENVCVVEERGGDESLEKKILCGLEVLISRECLIIKLVFL